MVKPAPEFDQRQRILDASAIERIIGELVTLKPKGREFACLCPFHNDHNPSMYVVPAKQIFHCFVCGAGGNAIDFVMKYHGMGFREALEYLASRAGIELISHKIHGGEATRGNPGGETGASRQDLIAANAEAMRFFRGILKHPEHGASSRAVIERRGISPEMVESFGLGASPDRWDGLVQYIAAKDLDQRAFIAAGLIKRRENSDGCYDILRHRIIFPIFDQIGRAVAFGGRKIRDEDDPKYLNSPETKVFDKGGTLFGLKQAQRSIQEMRTAVITEGYTDVIACHQHGFTNVVAALGTAFTPKHAAILRRLCDRVVFLFDGDEAGQRAADRALEVFFSEPIDVKIATMCGGAKDPDELLKREGGVEALRNVIGSARDLLDFRFDRLRSALDDRGLDVGSKARAAALESEIDRLLELGLRQLPPLQRDTVERKLARLAGTDPQQIKEAIRQRNPTYRTASGAGAGAAGGNDPEPAGWESAKLALDHVALALGCILVEPSIATNEASALDDLLVQAAYRSPPMMVRLTETMRDMIDGGAAPSRESILVSCEDPEVREAVSRLGAEIDRRSDSDHDRVMALWRDCLKRLHLDRAVRNIREASTGALGGASEGAEALSAVEAAVTLSRKLHQELGGNPLAMPRPRLRTG